MKGDPTAETKELLRIQTVDGKPMSCIGIMKEALKGQETDINKQKKRPQWGTGDSSESGTAEEEKYDVESRKGME